MEGLYLINFIQRPSVLLKKVFYFACSDGREKPSDKYNATAKDAKKGDHIGFGNLGEFQRYYIGAGIGSTSAITEE